MSGNFIRKSVRAMTGYLPGEQPVGSNRIKLNTNENPYPPSPRVADALRSWPVDALRLYPDPVCRALREKISVLHRARVEQVFVGNGSDEILALCLRAFVERDGAVGYFDPSYSLYPVLAAIEEVATRPVPLAEDFTWRMPDALRASLFFLCNPNAPTSLLFPRPRVEAFCRTFPGVVVLDEAYVDFASAHCMDLALSLDNVLVARSLSKAYSLAGLRLGYAVGSVELINALYKIKDSYNVSALAQGLAAAALADQPHLRANVEKIRATRRRTTDELRRRGFHVVPSETNFLWVRPSGGTAEQVFSALRERSIFVRHFPGRGTGDHLRISIGTDPEMDALLRALDEMLPPLPPRG